MFNLFELSSDEFISEVTSKIKKAKLVLNRWRDEAIDNYDFVAGDQWDVKDLEKMRVEERPVVTFNRTEINLDVILGVDMDNEQDILAIPRDVGDTAVNEVVSSAIKYIRDSNNASSEETEIFYDLLTTGVGVGEIFVDYSSDPEGEIVISRTDPLEMVWDPFATKKNLLDQRWCAREKRLDIDEIKFLWPTKTKELAEGDGESSIIGTDNQQGNVTINNPNLRYSGINSYVDDTSFIDPDGKIPVIEFQWFEYGEVVRFVAPDTGQIVKIIKSRFDKIKNDLNIGSNFVVLKEKVFYKAFFYGDTLLERTLGASQKRFTYLFATGKRDRNSKTWYGIVRGIKDPQKWANKFFSSIIEIIGKNAKGGAFAETDAFMDVRDAESQWSKASPLIMLKRGGIGKIRDRAVNQYPSGIERIMTFAIESIRDVSGINVELLGIADRRQAGVVETSRKQAGMAILGVFFGAMRLFRVVEGQLILEFIREFYTPEKLLRVDIMNQQYVLQVQQLFSDNDVTKFDVVVDQAPMSVSSKERTWFAMQNLLPILLNAGVPIPPEVLDYSPLPASLAQRWKQLLPGAMQASSPTTNPPGVPSTGDNTSPQNIDQQNSVLQSLGG